MRWFNMQTQRLFCIVAVVMTLGSSSAYADNNNQDDSPLIGDWRWWDESGRLAESKTHDGTQQAGADVRDVIQTGRAPGAAQAR
jgi:hypothetical protein